MNDAACLFAKRPGGRIQLRFTQVGVPARDYARKNQGWRTHYWQPLKRFLEKQQLLPRVSGRNF